MQEHPVPQNITAYEFHLIGSMTIKQFLILLGGGAIGLFFYSTNLPGIIKWPLVLIGALSGVAMAFVPYEERTLDQWFINFIKAIYRPTKYYWRRTPHVPEFFTYVASSNTQILYRPDTSPLKRTQVSQYLSSLSTPSNAEPADKLDIFQSNTDVLSLFNEVAAATNVAPSQETISRPSLTPRARPLGRTQVVYSTSNTTSDGATGSTVEPVVPSTMLETPAAILTEEREPEPVAEQAHQTHEARVSSLNLISVEASSTLTPQEGPDVAPMIEAAPEAHYLPAQNADRATSSIQPAIFRKDLPFPSLPTQPNLLIGMVHDAAHAIIPNAIVEILDASGNTVRAMKTNSLGQFYISSPLQSGTYTLETEKDGFSFPVYGFEAKNQILDPIDIQANG